MGAQRGMGMEQIAPLAKILAEANGIDWQQLRGSGSGGTVVEQDILNYLSRIMSGEEEPPSTPVDDMPEGWTGDEALPTGMFSAAQLSEAGIDSDIADFVTQPRAPELPTAPTLNHDALEFELDDAGDLDAPLAAEPQPVAAEWSFAPAQPRAEQPPHIEAPQPTAPAPAPAFPSLSAPEPQPAPEVHMPEVQLPEAHVPEVQIAEVQTPAASAHGDVAAAGGAAAGLSGLLSRLYRKDREAEPTPPQPATPTPQPAPQAAAPSLGQQDQSFTFAPQPTSQQSGQQPAGQPGAQAAELELQVPAALPVTEMPVAEMPVTEMPVVEMPVAALPTAEPVAAEVSEPEAPAPVAEQRPAAQPAPASPATPASAVWFGTYLRRDADVGAAGELCAQLSEALGQDVSLAFLVARAARRHADALGLDLGSVALQGADGQDQPVAGGALRDAVAALRGGPDRAPDLLVTDAGALGVDDLHYPHALTLSLGRVQDGRAALSLNGDVDPRQAAQFLGRVAGALEKPIALVL